MNSDHMHFDIWIVFFNRIQRTGILAKYVSTVLKCHSLALH